MIPDKPKDPNFMIDRSLIGTQRLLESQVLEKENMTRKNSNFFNIKFKSLKIWIIADKTFNY